VVYAVTGGYATVVVAYVEVCSLRKCLAIRIARPITPPTTPTAIPTPEEPIEHLPLELVTERPLLFETYSAVLER